MLSREDRIDRQSSSRSNGCDSECAAMKDPAQPTPWVSRLKRMRTVLLIGAVLAVVLRADVVKFWVFERSCSSAEERVYRTLSSDAVAIEYRPWSGVIEDRYYPTHLANTLLQGSERLAKVQLVFDVPPGKAVESCVGTYVISAVKPSELHMPACGKMTPTSRTSLAAVRVSYSYGDTNFWAVRPFRFSLEDKETGQLLAEQRSFQLLLGGMSSPENRAWYGWGTAQGARVCNLTDPRTFVLRALGVLADTSVDQTGLRTSNSTSSAINQ